MSSKSYAEQFDYFDELFTPVEPHRLKSLLDSHRIKQSQAAKKLGVSLTYFNMCLNGHTVPSKSLSLRMDALAELMSSERDRKENNNGK